MKKGTKIFLAAIILLGIAIPATLLVTNFLKTNPEPGNGEGTGNGTGNGGGTGNEPNYVCDIVGSLTNLEYGNSVDHYAQVTCNFETVYGNFWTSKFLVPEFDTPFYSGLEAGCVVVVYQIINGNDLGYQYAYKPAGSSSWYCFVVLLPVRDQIAIDFCLSLAGVTI